jgi:periplasmic copper chaperone A
LEAIVKIYRLSILALFIPSLAAAHVGISGPAIANKSGQKITFAISHGCTKGAQHLDTLSVQIDIPQGIDPASVRPMPNDFAPTPAVTKNGTSVVSVKWSRDPAELQSDDVAFYEFTLRLKVNDVPFTRIPFVVTQVCRPKGGTELDDVTVVWTGPPTVTEPSPQLVVVPARSPGWNKITLTAAVAEKDFGTFFGDAQMVWKGTSAFSPNATVTTLIRMTSGVTELKTDLAAGDEIWVKY